MLGYIQFILYIFLLVQGLEKTGQTCTQNQKSGDEEKIDEKDEQILRYESRNFVLETIMVKNCNGPQGFAPTKRRVEKIKG